MIPAKRAIWAVALAFLDVWVANEQSLAADPPHESLVIGVAELPATPLPVGPTTSSAMTYLRGFVGRSLTAYDRSWAVICELCVTLPTLHNGLAKIVERADGSKGIDETFELAPGLSWDDGVPVSSADVVFSVAVAHRFGRGAANLSDIRAVDGLDDRHFVVRTNAVRFDYNTFDNLYLIPAHLEEAILGGAYSPEAYAAHSAYKVDPGRRGLYNGPYRIKDFDAEHVVLVRNEAWFGRKPAFDTIVLRRVPPGSTLEDELVNGRIDMIPGELGIGTEAAFALEQKDTKSRFDFIFKTELEYDHIDFNLKNPALADRRVRHALLWSVDRLRIFGANEGADTREIAASFLPPTSPNYDPTLTVVRYDPQAADALFREAGYSPGPDGIRVDRSGHRLSFRMLSRSSDHPLIAELKSQWAAAGVEIKPDDRLFLDTLMHREFDMAYYAWRNTPEFLIEPVYAGSGIPRQGNDFVGLNYPGLNNPEMNKIAAALTSEMDPSRRLTLWQKAQQIYAEELPALPLSFMTNAYVVPNWLAGVEPTGHMIPTSFWVEEWHIR